MAKLSNDVLREGRSLVISSDLEGLMAWTRQHAPTVDQAMVESTFRLIFLAQDTPRGLKFFNAAFADYDPTTAKIISVGVVAWGAFKLGLGVMILVGSFGGAVYLFRALVGP